LTKKQEDIKQIIQALLNKNKTTGFTKTEIEDSIVKVKLIGDRRSIENWFGLLFKLGYFEQPQPNRYSLILSEITSLDVTVPEVNQRRLEDV